MISRYWVQNDVTAYREVEYLNYLQGVSKMVYRSVWFADMRTEIWAQDLQIARGIRFLFYSHLTATERNMAALKAQKAISDNCNLTFRYRHSCILSTNEA